MTDDKRLPSEMPYRRTDGACDICGSTTDKLRRVTLKPASGSWGGFKAARVVYVCEAHAIALEDEAAERPPTTRQLAAGTTRRAPQDETLFPLKPRAEGET